MEVHTVGIQGELEKCASTARFVTRTYDKNIYETWSVTSILGQLGITQEQEKKIHCNRHISLCRGLNDNARIPSDDLILKTRRCMIPQSKAFQTASATSRTKIMATKLISHRIQCIFMLTRISVYVVSIFYNYFVIVVKLKMIDAHTVQFRLNLILHF